MQTEIGIMQGRLLPRVKNKYQAFPDNWQSEFKLAEDFGFKYVEFIFESKLEVEEIRNIYSESLIRIKSICADYFMDYPIFKGNKAEISKQEYILITLICDARKLNIEHITIPCVDNSSLKTKEDIDVLIKILKNCLCFALLGNVCINLETDLLPYDILKLIENINHPNIKINYDMGNSASLGYDPDEEFSLYGDKIGVVHIKDRLFNGSSVKLGTGNVDFKKVFDNLKKINFSGPLVMQAYREENYLDDLETLVEQFQFIKNFLPQ